MVKAPSLSGTRSVGGRKDWKVTGIVTCPMGKASNEGASMGSSVIIVGAWPVGLSLALSLGHSGVDSIILEKNNGLQP
jgi:ribulose 1,5-bisphosphate synthetase/thiazole synthase